MHSDTRTPHTSVRHYRLPLLLALALVAAALASLVGAGPAPAAARSTGTDDPAIQALARAARPLDSTEPGAPARDLLPLDRMIGSAKIVGVGEATHNSREFFRMKHRLFQHLVEEKGFTMFALEANWSAGLRLNDYVLHGKGNPKQIMREEFQESYLIWNVREYLDLVTWMRSYNIEHPDPADQVQFMGDDMAYAGPALFDSVLEYVGAHHPRLKPEFERLYRASRPTTGVRDWIKAYMVRPLPERRRMAADVQRAFELLERQGPGADREQYAWVLQHARVIAQVGKEFGYDFFDEKQLAEAMLHRDRSMAANTLWWQRQTGHRMLLSAHNGHVGFETSNPKQYPKLQGQFLREQAGTDYRSIGFTFGQGSFNALDLNDPEEHIREFSVGAPAPGSNEHTLEQVRRGDYYLDLRRVSPAARTWLSGFRPTWSIGNAWPDQPQPVRLGTSYDVLVHLHRITAADRL
ncbi:erythromycin esterase family protein [Streptomyces sp. NBC_01304]|uniref:erythromycin esterase family protein n=1 Tax=Streptomyces sp. NBC_01304 TaxID=2903818 RepID=UPI002E0E2324|nr:erythromycin esterase family protein [Streptomyces sp. NBC_01304]